ncbi:MAG: bifunctional DNA-formamidopyrimidine glycosylase/DNA-(apurinic or apyrimidinic site) lyase [Patescibacteria group bacterium]
MPELPEVQTIVTDLKKVLPELKIQDVWCDNRKMIKSPNSLSAFKKKIIGEKILGLERKGKNILIGLSGKKTLLIHQKMTGHMLYGDFEYDKDKWVAKKPGPLRDDPQNRFIHLIFSLSNKKCLALSDLRKFAKVLICETRELGELKDLKNIGPDPLEKSFSFKKFESVLGKRRGKVKDVLIKQEIISGIGNIYASEILWDAGVYPFKNLQDLSGIELKKIYKSIHKILKQGIKQRGDSVVDYRDPSGKKGKYQKFHKAYQREGEKCSKKDGGIIRRFKKGGRSTFFCSKHQK